MLPPFPWNIMTTGRVDAYWTRGKCESWFLRRMERVNEGGNPRGIGTTICNTSHVRQSTCGRGRMKMSISLRGSVNEDPCIDELTVSIHALGTGEERDIYHLSAHDFRHGRRARCRSEYGGSSNRCHVRTTSPARQSGIVVCGSMTEVMSRALRAGARSRGPGLRFQ